MSLEQLHRQLSEGLGGLPSSLPTPSVAVERRRQRLGLGAAVPAERIAPSLPARVTALNADDDDDAVLQAALQASLLDTRPPGRPLRTSSSSSSSSSSFSSSSLGGEVRGQGMGRDERWAQPPPRPSSSSFGGASQIALQDLDLDDEDDDLLAQAIRESLK